MSKKFKITKTQNSRIGEADLENPGFGSIFTDHMMVCEYSDGEWQTPEIKPYGPFQLDPAAKIFHYGQSIFEGMKAFKSEKGEISVFRPEQNFERFNKSAERMCIPTFPKEIFFEGLDILLDLERDWINTKNGYSLYIRPFMFATENQISASPSTKYIMCIVCSPVKSYYTPGAGGIKVLVQDRYSRSADGGVGYVKNGGNYGASFYPTELAKKKGYAQIIWTDSETHQFMEEAGTMNVFFRIGDVLITAPTNDRILNGVTRRSLIQLAEDQGIKVDVRDIKVQEIIEAHGKGELKEIFGAGTAAIVQPLSGFGYKGKDYDLPQVENPYGPQLKKAIQDIQYGRVKDKYSWLYQINN